MSAAHVALPLGATTTSTVPVISETKNAHWCDTPRSRGFAVGSRIASLTVSIASVTGCKLGRAGAEEHPVRVHEVHRRQDHPERPPHDRGAKRMLSRCGVVDGKR